eukprot:13397236-Alexandrium_andersonii.AAC.1
MAPVEAKSRRCSRRERRSKLRSECCAAARRPRVAARRGSCGASWWRKSGVVPWGTATLGTEKGPARHGHATDVAPFHWTRWGCRPPGARPALADPPRPPRGRAVPKGPGGPAAAANAAAGWPPGKK